MKLAPEIAAPDAQRATTTLVGATLVLLFTYIFLANAWMGDDAYITFRVVWNFVHGYGLTFNPDERVQAYTHPLWMLLVSGAYFATREFFFTVTTLSWGLLVATGVVLFRWCRTPSHGAVLVLWLLASKAFVDYTSSGLENPLSYLLLALFYTRYLSRPTTDPPQLSELGRLTFLASLAFLARPDAVTLYVIPLLEMSMRTARTHGVRVLRPLVAGTAPAWLWLAFATFYYGFPLPNTYYAKVANGIPRVLMFEQGLAYVLNSIRWDPITLTTIALAFALGVREGATRRAAAASLLLSVAYTVSVGGDFMSGRFFSAPFLLAAMLVAPSAAVLSVPVVVACLALYTFLTPLAPVKTGASYDGAWPWRSQNGIKDERGHYHQGTNLLFYSPFRELPDFPFLREGRSFRDAPERATVHGSIGMFGLAAGPAKHVIDRNALSDPLLARLPVSPRLSFEFYAGHYFRDLPAGYVESHERGENLVEDPRLHRYYDRIRNVTRGALVRLDRFRDILALNLGSERRFDAEYERHRPVALSIRADNERFLTHVGTRDTAAGVLRTTGAQGYLQYGPGIPLKAGRYRVRWIGVVEEEAGTEAGFVDVSLDRTTSLRRAPLVATGVQTSGPIAQLDFILEEPARAVDYRLWVKAGIALRLERVELYSAAAAPRD